jgi:hypothetical protein
MGYVHVICDRITSLEREEEEEAVVTLHYVTGDEVGYCGLESVVSEVDC